MDIESAINPEVVFGPIYPFILEETIEEIWINSPQRIFIARKGKSELTNLILTDIQVKELIDRALMWSGRRLDLSNPFVDARLPDGSRLHVAIPEITAEHWAVNIRKHIAQNLTLMQLCDAGLLDKSMVDFLIEAVKQGKNILVSGGTQAGKTTLLNALAGEIPYSQRVVTIEEVFEIAPRLPDLIQLQTRSANLQGEGEINLRRLVKESLRMRPNRIIIGEVREAEALDLLIALNSGLPGMGTIHANSARDAVLKLQTLPLLAGSNISHSFTVQTVASAIDLVVQVSLGLDGSRRVIEISALTGRTENLNIEVEQLWRWNGNVYVEEIGLSAYRQSLGMSAKPQEINI
jgi:pilus assembly protein CpaF